MQARSSAAARTVRSGRAAGPRSGTAGPVGAARLWGTSLAALGSSFVLMLLLGIGTADNLLLVVAASIVPSALLIAFNLLARQREIFTPINFVLVSIFFGVTVQSVYLCLLDDRSHRFAVGIATDADSLMVAIAAISLGMLALVCGYAFARSRPGPRPPSLGPDGWARGRLLSVCTVLMGISLVSLAYYAVFFDVLDQIAEQFSVKRRVVDEDTGVSRTLGYVRFGVNLSQLAFFLLATYYFSFPKRARPLTLRPLLWAAGLAGLVMPFVASSRLGLLSFVLGGCIIHHYASGGWKIRRAGTVLVAAVAVILLMGVLRYTQTRGLSYDEYRSGVSVVEMAEPLLGSSNFMGVGKTAAIIEAVPDRLDYLYGTSYLTWIVAPIPRAIWPDKPIIRIGRVLGYAIFGTADTTGIPPGAVGELYLNFGWLGIPLGMLAFGLFLGWYARKLTIGSYSNINLRVIYAATLVFVAYTGISSDFNGTVSAVLQRLVPLLGLLWFVNKGSVFGRSARADGERRQRQRGRPRRSMA